MNLRKITATLLALLTLVGLLVGCSSPAEDPFEIRATILKVNQENETLLVRLDSGFDSHNGSSAFFRVDNLEQFRVGQQITFENCGNLAEMSPLWLTCVKNVEVIR